MNYYALCALKSVRSSSSITVLCPVCLEGYQLNCEHDTTVPLAYIVIFCLKAHIPQDSILDGYEPNKLKFKLIARVHYDSKSESLSILIFPNE